MFEDLSEKYTDVLSMQTPQFIGIWQKANASKDSSGKQIEEQGQHPIRAQAMPHSGFGSTVPQA